MMIAWILAGCTSTPPAAPEPEPEPAPPPAPVVEGRGPSNLRLGEWAGELASKGGPLRFRMHIGEGCATELRVAGQSFPTVARCQAGTLSLRFPPYLGSLTATITDDGDGLRGQYDFQRGGEWRHLGFTAGPLAPPEYLPVPEGAPAAVNLELAGREGAVLLELQRGGAGRVHGSISAPTGDWGPLEGGWTDEGLQLSGFDGAHGFLVKLAPDEEGRFTGQVWNRDGDSQEATEVDDGPDLDGWDALNAESIDLTGVSLQRIGGEIEALPTNGPRIVHLSGTWCPNCNDAAPLIEALAQENPGLAVLGLSWEAGAPPARADRQIRQFRLKFGITHPLYRLDDKPTFLEAVPAWPTTLFVRDDGSVQAAHVGFLGPSTPNHDTLVERYREEAAKLASP